MKRSGDGIGFCLARVVLLYSFSSCFLGDLFAQSVPRGPQYRYRNVSIPAAHAEEQKKQKFSPEAAREYLDPGASLWAKQKKCFSCHTHGIYMAVRPALSPWLGDPPEGTREFLVEQFKEIQEEDDRSGTGSTRMAYVARGLAAWDEQFGDVTSPETDEALRYLFEMQAEDGSIRARNSWPPLNSGIYHGTIMAAMALASAPDWPAAFENPKLHSKVHQLGIWLRDTAPKNDHERLLLLWASTVFPRLLDDERRQSFVDMLWKQQREDGGWSTRTFATGETWGGGVRAEKMMAQPDYNDPPSDGYQTGLAVIVLRDAGVPADDLRIQKGVQWLLVNQRESGRWWTASLNADSRFHYITYSGTAYATLALAKCGALNAAP